MLNRNRKKQQMRNLFQTNFGHLRHSEIYKLNLCGISFDKCLEEKKTFMYVVCTYVYWNLCSRVQNVMNIKTYVKIFHRAKCYLQKLYKITLTHL